MIIMPKVAYFGILAFFQGFTYLVILGLTGGHPATYSFKLTVFADEVILSLCYCFGNSLHNTRVEKKIVFCRYYFTK